MGACFLHHRLSVCMTLPLPFPSLLPSLLPSSPLPFRHLPACKPHPVTHKIDLFLLFVLSLLFLSLLFLLFLFSSLFFFLSSLFLLSFSSLYSLFLSSCSEVRGPWQQFRGNKSESIRREFKSMSLLHPSLTSFSSLRNNFVKQFC